MDRTYEFGRVCPGDGAHGDGEGADEEVGEDDDRLRDPVVAVDHPDAVAVDDAPVAEAALEATDEEEPEAHEEGTGEEHGTTTPLVDVDDSGDREHDVEDVLDGVGDEVTATTSETGTLEDVDDVVPAARR